MRLRIVVDVASIWSSSVLSKICVPSRSSLGMSFSSVPLPSCASLVTEAEIELLDNRISENS